MNQKNETQTLAITALLIALGILIPLVMPAKIVIGPASFTLASHVPVMLAMFFAPSMAAYVALGTTFGFFLAIPVPTIWLRALTHLVFAVFGAIYLKKNPSILEKQKSLQIFNFVLGCCHAFMEVLVVFAFYSIGFGHMDNQKLFEFLLLIGFGTVAHSMVDFQISYLLAKNLSKIFPIPVFVKK